MLTGIYRLDRPALLFTLPLWALLAWSGALIGDAPLSSGPHMPLFQPLGICMERWPWCAAILGVLFTIGIGAQLVFLVNDAELSTRRNHLPMILLPMLMALVPGGPVMNASLAGLPLVLWAFRRLWVAGGRRGGPGILFDTGLLLGGAALVYLPYCFLLVVVWATNAVMRPFHWRDHLIPLVGVSLSFLVCHGVMVVAGIDGWAPMSTLIPRVPAGVLPWPSWWYLPLVVGVLSLFTIAATFAFVRAYRRSVMHGKNMRAAFLAFSLACALLVGFDLILTHALPAALTATPLAVLFAAPLLDARRAWLADAGLMALLALALWAQWTTGLSSPA